MIQRVFKRTDERIDFGLIGRTAARRRHQAAPQFSYGLFPDLGVLTDVVQRHSGESDTTGPAGSAVASDAVRVEHAPNRSNIIDTSWWSGLRLRHGLRGDSRQNQKDKGQALHRA